MDKGSAIRYFNGLARGLGPDTLGAPVDAATQLANLAIAGGGYLGHKAGLIDTPPGLIEKAVGGSDWIAEKLGNADDGSAAYTAGRLTPLVVGLAKPVSWGAVRALEKGLAGPSAGGKAAQRGGLKAALSREELLREFERVTGYKSPTALESAEAGVYFRNQMRGNKALGGALEQSLLTPEVQELMTKLQATETKRQLKYLYHSTPPERVESIRMQGLLPGSAPNYPELSRKGLYFAATPEGARYFGKPGDALLRVPTGSGPKSLEPDIFGGDGSFFTEEAVSPQVIELLQNRRWSRF